MLFIYPMMTRLSLICLFPIVLCLTVAGCGGEPRPDGLPELFPVTLTFTQEGEPCVEAIVTLIPESDSPWGTGGITDANGRVAVRTHGKFLGAPAGRYRVTISKTESGVAGPAPADMFTVQTIQTFHLIDPTYADFASTPLIIEVEANRRGNSFPPFELGERVREPVRLPGM